MQDPKSMSDEELEHTRDLGAATYLSAYVHLMARKLDVYADSDFLSINAMALPMIEPLNHALTACWCSTMKDSSGVAKAVGEFQKAVNALQRG